MSSSYLKALPYAASALAGALAVYLWHDAVVSRMERDAAQAKAEAAQDLQAEQTKAQKEVAKIEQYYHDKIQAGLAAIPEPATQRVFIRAACPAVPEAGDSGVDSSARAELDADHRRLVRDLRAGAVRLENKLAACQAILKAE